MTGISQERLKQWTEMARRDDWHQTFVGSDIRVMLGEIERLQMALRAVIFQDHHNHGPESMATKIAREALNQQK